MLQFTRMGLGLTAVADSLTGLILAGQGSNWPAVVAMSVCSLCLYGYGMALNDLVDRHRDAAMAGHKPLPSGRLAVGAAHWIVAVLVLFALGSAAWLAGVLGSSWPMGMAAAAVVLITFYNLMGKWMPYAGLLSLGVIRGVNSLIGAPHGPMVLHPLALLYHVTILSIVGYVWEGKRPALMMRHLALLLVGMAGLTVVGVWLEERMTYAAIPVLVGLGLSEAIFWIWALGFASKPNTPVQVRGQRLILQGLLWLIVLDAVTVGTTRGWQRGLCVAALWPMAWLAVRGMRYWNAISLASGRVMLR